MMLVTMPRRLALALVALVVHAAAADPDPRKQAAALFEEGLAARSKDPAKACALFEKSYALDATAPGTALNVADCAERDGHLRRAAELFAAAATAFGRIKDPREKYARERGEAVAKRVATIILVLPEPTGAAVTIGGRVVATAAEIHEQVDPGEVAIEVTAPGRVTFVKSATLREGATETIEARLAVIAKPDAPPPPPPPPAALAQRSRSRVHLAWGLGAGAGAGIVATSVIAIVAKRDYDRAATGPGCTPSPFVCSPAAAADIDHARSVAKVGTVVGLASAALLVGMGVVYFTAPKEQLVVAPTASSTTVGLVLGRRF